MDLKHVLTFFGLLSDLVGAALLSIPMVWNARAAADWIIKVNTRARYFLYGPTMRPSGASKGTQISNDPVIQTAHERIVATGALFGLYFLIIAIRLIYVASARYRSQQAWVATPFVNDFLVTTIIGFATLLALVGVVLLIQLPTYLATGLMWVARGNYERRIGAVGLGMLCVGFLFQAAVNLM